MLFKKKPEESKEEQKPQVMQINLVDVVKQASIQMKYEEIGSWLVMHKTPLFWCHEKGLSIVDSNFIDQRPWLKKALNRMITEIEEQKQQKMQAHQHEHQHQHQPKHSHILEDKNKQPEGTGYIG